MGGTRRCPSPPTSAPRSRRPAPASPSRRTHRSTCCPGTRPSPRRWPPGGHRPARPTTCRSRRGTTGRFSSSTPTGCSSTALANRSGSAVSNAITNGPPMHIPSTWQRSMPSSSSSAELVVAVRGPSVRRRHRRHGTAGVALVHADQPEPVGQRLPRVPRHACPEVVGRPHPAGSDQQHGEPVGVAFEVVVDDGVAAGERRHVRRSPARAHRCGCSRSARAWPGRSP